MYNYDISLLTIRILIGCISGFILDCYCFICYGYDTMITGNVILLLS